MININKKARLYQKIVRFSETELEIIGEAITASRMSFSEFVRTAALIAAHDYSQKKKKTQD